VTVPPTVWDQVSAHYDRQLFLERRAVRCALALLAPRDGERILDVGTGTGEVLRQLARHPGRPRATGVDQSAAMLARVPELPAGWSVRVADARRLPFADGAFDAVTAAYLLQVLPVPDVSGAVGELLRVLRPGGRLVTVTPAIPPRGPLRLLGSALDGLAKRRPSRYGGLRALDPSAALEQAGLEIAAVRWSLRGYLSLCVLARRPT
jgi:ubiquinone/menaquinone biosynthesis C-methylase UbiE